MGKWIVIGVLILTSQAHADAGAAVGSCHLTILNSQGTVVGGQDLKLVPVNPVNHYGLILSGSIEKYLVIVELAVARFDEIGSSANDKVIMIINHHDAASSYHEMSGRSFVAGDSFNGSLAVNDRELNCGIERSAIGRANLIALGSGHSGRCTQKDTEIGCSSSSTLDETYCYCP